MNKIGKRVMINLESNGAGELSKTKGKVSRITADYGNGWVRVSSGDVWQVRPHAGSPDFEFIVSR